MSENPRQTQMINTTGVGLRNVQQLDTGIKDLKEYSDLIKKKAAGFKDLETFK